MNPLATQLDQHLQFKLANHKWLRPFLNCTDATTIQAAWFPYQANPSSSVKGTLLNREWTAITPAADINPNDLGQQTRYLAMIPCYAPNNLDLKPLLSKLRDEGFGQDAAASRTAAQSRLAVAVGLNRMKSLDPKENRKFRRLVQQSSSVDGLSAHLVGKLWNGVWIKQPEQGAQVYSKEKAFLLLKALRPRLAPHARKQIEGNGAFSHQVPYVDLREWVKNTQGTLNLETAFWAAGEGAVYAAIMDADTVGLRSENGSGLFSQYDALITEFNAQHAVLPQLLSTGYQVSSTEKDTLRLAVRIDMAVRSAMSSIDGLQLAPYYPEPNLAFLLTPAAPLSSWSFAGLGDTCESLRLVRNAVSKGILSPSRAIFKAQPGFITSTPDRMRFGTHTSIGSITKSKVGQIRVLKALRGPSQTHLFPKRWAEQLYGALSVKASRMTDVTTPLMALMAAFNPQDIAVALLRSTEGKYSAKDFPKALALMPAYQNYLEAVLLGRQTEAEALLAFLNDKAPQPGTRRQQLRGLLEGAIKKGQQNVKELRKQKVSQAERQRCVQAAAATGRAVVAELAKVVANNGL